MNQAQFATLIVGFCAECGLDEPERVVRGGPVEIGGIVFSLAWNAQPDPALFTIYCDYGAVSGSRELAIYKSLLEANMALFDGAGPAFTVSPDTGRVVLAEHRRLDATTPAGLRVLLNQMRAQALAWRADYSLTPASGAHAARPAPASQRTRHSMANRLLSLGRPGIQ